MTVETFKCQWQLARSLPPKHISQSSPSSFMDTYTHLNWASVTINLFVKGCINSCDKWLWLFFPLHSIKSMIDLWWRKRLTADLMAVGTITTTKADIGLSQSNHHQPSSVMNTHTHLTSPKHLSQQGKWKRCYKPPRSTTHYPSKTNTVTPPAITSHITTAFAADN